jgi:hypothetical protein
VTRDSQRALETRAVNKEPGARKYTFIKLMADSSEFRSTLEKQACDRLSLLYICRIYSELELGVVGAELELAMARSSPSAIAASLIRPILSRSIPKTMPRNKCSKPTMGSA